MNAAHYTNLVLFRTYAELKAEATRAYLGFLWWFFEPVLYMAVFYFVFEVGLRSGGAGFVPFLLCGLVAWKWFGSSVMAASGALTRNAGLIQQVYVPKVILPLSSVASNTVKFVIILLILLAVLWLGFGQAPTRSWLLLPVLLLVQLVLVAGCSLFVAAIVPFAQDIKVLLDNVMMMLFFISGIFFDINRMPENAQALMRLNPIAVIIDGYRALLLRDAGLDTGGLLYVAACAAGIGVVGLLILHRYDRVYPKMILK